MTLSAKEFSDIIELIQERCGILLDTSKEYLIKSRLEPLLQKNGCSNYSDLCLKARGPLGKTLINEIVDSISTNETSFFRDRKPFELLKNTILPEWQKRSGPGRKLRIWSAACSTGQEVYSIALVLHEFFRNKFKDSVEIIGSDVAFSVLKKAQQGIYSKYEVSRGITPEMRARYFSEKNGDWEVCPELRAVIAFKKQNLFDSYSDLGKFDLIFCRNVAIYFSMENRGKLFTRIADILKPDGLLIIGSTESLFGVCARFERQEQNGASYYRLK